MEETRGRAKQIYGEGAASAKARRQEGAAVFQNSARARAAGTGRKKPETGPCRTLPLRWGRGRVLGRAALGSNSHAPSGCCPKADVWSGSRENNEEASRGCRYRSVWAEARAVPVAVGGAVKPGHLEGRAQTGLLADGMWLYFSVTAPRRGRRDQSAEAENLVRSLAAAGSGRWQPRVALLWHGLGGLGRGSDGG